MHAGDRQQIISGFRRNAPDSSFDLTTVMW